MIVISHISLYDDDYDDLETILWLNNNNTLYDDQLLNSKWNNFEIVKR